MKLNSWYQYIIAWLVVEIQGNALYCLFNLISSKELFMSKLMNKIQQFLWNSIIVGLGNLNPNITDKISITDSVNIQYLMHTANSETFFQTTHEQL